MPPPALNERPQQIFNHSPQSECSARGPNQSHRPSEFLRELSVYFLIYLSYRYYLNCYWHRTIHRRTPYIEEHCTNVCRCCYRRMSLSATDTQQEILNESLRSSTRAMFANLLILLFLFLSLLVHNRTQMNAVYRRTQYKTTSMQNMQNT